MRMFKKVLSVALSIMMLCAMMAVGVTVSAADTVFSKNFEDGQVGFSSDCPLEVADGVLHWDASKANWANVYAYISVEANTDYQVSFKLKANMASGLTVKFLAADWVSTVAQESAAATTEWTEYDVTLNGGSGGTVVFMIQTGVMGSAGQQIYLDDVSVAKKGASSEPETPDTPVTPSEPALGETGLVQNGNFETGNNTGWKLYQNTKVDAAAAKTGSYGLHIVGNGGWGGLGNQQINGLEIGKVYRISLWYKTLSNGVNIQLCEGTSDAGAKLAYVYGTSTSWTEFAVEFEATTTSVFFTLVGAGNNQATEMYMDDISLTEVVLGGNDDDPNLKLIDTLMDNVKTQGRTAMVRGTLMLDFSISGIEFELDCAGDVYATFNASKISNSGSEGGVYFTIIVDGVKKARDYCRIASVGETKVKLAEGLSAGKHTFAIYRQSEHSYGEVGVCALSYDGEMLAKPADKDLYIEFIGDSISCGYGNLIANGQGNNSPGASLYSDGTQAYTYLTAKALNADWSTVSWSGLGCKYGYSSTTMQDVYPAQRYNYDQKTQYDFAKKADVVVLALGTNDNSIQYDAALKRAGLVEMLQLVRAKNPDAPIVWIHGMMTNGVSSMIEEIVAEFGGEEAGYYACRLTQNNAGGGSHPSLSGQQKFADELVAFLTEKGLTEGTPDTPVIPPVDPDEPTEPGTLADLITGGETSRMEMKDGLLGLAFRFTVHAQGVAADGNVVDYTNATIDVFGDGTQYKLVGMGAVMSNNPSKGLSLEAMVRANTNGMDLLDIPVKYLYNLDEETGAASFAVRITNIPAECEETIIYARPYYIFEDAEGNQIEVYDHVEYTNYNDDITMNDGVLDWD